MSRTDASQDITGQVGGAGQRLADARALRTSLLRQLANATTQDQINSLKAQIRDASGMNAGSGPTWDGNSGESFARHSRSKCSSTGRSNPRASGIL